MANRKRLVGVVGGLGVAAVGVLLLTMEGDGQFEIGMALIPIGLILSFVVGLGRTRKGAADNSNDDYQFDQDRYTGLDDDDD
ncbi:MAG: hypothetical protein RIM84_01110 [Alphaproteobacteria bacterium]